MSPGKRLRVAVAGLGVIAQTVHLPLLERRRDLFELVAVADLSPSRAREVGGRYGVPERCRLVDGAELLDVAGLDAVLLLTSGSHGDLAAAALRRGVPVFCEKPLAHTRAEAAELAPLAAGEDRLMVGYMKQYDPVVVELARRLDRIGGAGAVHAVEVTVLHPSGGSQLAAHRLAPAPTDADGERVRGLRERADELLTRAVGPDPAVRALYQIMINSVSHDLSLLRLLTGAPGTVQHVALWPAEPAPGHEPSVEVSGELPAGGRYGIRWLYLPDYPGYRETVTLHHARGSFELVFPTPYRPDRPATLTVRDGDDGDDGDDGVERRCVHRGNVSAFERQLVAFHAMVTTGAPPRTGLAGGTADIVTSQQVVRRFGELTGTAVGGEAATG
ncbi:Gfo/Idh/MocA family protein [Plantactinospora sp. BC1]|uniref:Gfo/Idh/MocA family protein n=1 Tax=Plantactinospora sp. BC1 TaxID=2108470 RepID=UPI0018FE4AC1|nr:Gfo/Idh/MocA family oxidoreductase [Plantactinospora sp. BC1]